MKGFRDFILRGNVVDLAVGVVMGVAFSAVVTAFVNSFINPLIKVFTGGGKVGGQFTVRGAVFDWGAFVSTVIYFVLIAAVVYFLVVIPVNKLLARAKRGEVEADPVPPEEVVLLTEIRDTLQRNAVGERG